MVWPLNAQWKKLAASKLMANRADGILLDTSVVVAHLRGKIDILALITPAESVFLPLVALGELYKGAEKSAYPARNRQLVDEFLQLTTLLFPDHATAVSYAKIAAHLEARGEIIPENDLWIAAVAIECDMPLATLDAHFQRVDELTILRW